MEESRMLKHYFEDGMHLSLFERSDAGTLFKVIDENREHLGEWLKFPSMTRTENDSLQFIERVRLRFARDEGYWLGIWNDNELLGSIGFLYIDQENRKSEIGYWLDKRHEGKGIISKSIKVLLDHAFNKLNINKIEIGVAEDNFKSRAIPEKLGFTEE